MAKNQSITEWLQSLPKWGVYALMAGILVVVGIPMVYYGFGFNKKPQEETRQPVKIDMQDADVESYDKTRMQTYQDADMNKNINKNRDDYWDSLSDDLVSKGNVNDDLSGYTPNEQYLIRNGLKTREQVDRERAAEAAAAAQRTAALSGYGSGSAAPQRPMTQDQKDSAYFARLERSMQIASKYMPQDTGTEAPEQPQPTEPVEEKKEEEQRKIDITNQLSNLPSDSFSGDGIVTSLVGPEESDVVHYAGTKQSKPVKATFLKNETLSNGQRVIIRLMQDMTLSDGTIIPANTHITGTCAFSSRLKIDVKMLHYNGRMFPTDISVYDNDGTEGIYCPTVEKSKKNKRRAKEVAGGTMSALGSVAGTLLMGNPFIGRIASTGLSAATSVINDDGSVSVKVSPGYEFYVFENVKKDGKGMY